MHAIARLGEKVWAQADEVRHVAALIGAVSWAGVQPRHWARPARNALARQVFAIGVEPLLFVCALAVFVGIGVVVQLAFWTGATGQSQLLGLVWQTQTSMLERERLIDAAQRHWLLRKYVNKTNPPSLRPLPAREEPARKPVRAQRSPKNSTK